MNTHTIPGITLHQTALQAGFTHTIPVIPFNATLHEHSQIDPAMRGKVPGEFYQGAWDGLAGWRDFEMTMEQAVRFDSLGANVGLLMGVSYVALDVDVTDPKLAEAMRSRILELGGQAWPMRIGQAPKCLYLFRVQGDPIQAIQYPLHRGEDKQLVEVLGQTPSGHPRQAVIHGMHPTGLPYYWNVEHLTSDALPVATQDGMNNLVEELLKVADADGWTRGKPSRQGTGETSSLGAEAADPALVVEMVDLIPNDMLTYDDWVRVGYAIKAAMGEDGLLVFERWSAKSAKNVPAVTLKMWKGFTPSGQVGFGTLQYLAKEANGGRLPGDLSERASMARTQAQLATMPEPTLPPGAVPLDAPVRLSDNFFVGAVQHVWEGVKPERLPMLRLTKDGNPAMQQVAAPSNILYLMGVAGMTKRLNLMTHKVEWEFDGKLGGYVGEKPNDVAEPILKEMAARCWISPTAAQTAFDDITPVSYHPMEDWLDNLPEWDGTDRLAEMADSMPSPNPEAYRRAVVSKWFIQAVQAVKGWRDEERQIPHVLVFAGPQGAGKTRWVTTCAPEEFTAEGVLLDLSGDPVKDRDSITSATATPIAELGELEATFSKSGIEALKNFLSKSSNTFRMAYARREASVRRCTVFAGTVNSMGFLHDETGARRFWPIEIDGNLEPVSNIEQVWAQALHLWLSGATWFLSDDEKQMHAEIVEYHSEGSSVEDLMADRFPLGFWTRHMGVSAADTDPSFEVLTLTEIMTKAGIQQAGKNRRLVRSYVEKHGGRMGRWVDASGRRRNSTVMVITVDRQMPILPPFVNVQ